jgi:hypothetical protein
VDTWRSLPNPSQWQVTPETARLIRHWRDHKFNAIQPFFCQVEAAEVAIWLTEVAPQSRNGKRIDAIGFDIFSPCEDEPPRGFDISEALGPGGWA